MGTQTPWGIADYSKKIAPGIMVYSTPGHGGIHLSPKRQQEIPECLRVNSGWYEEDCDWALVAIAFPQYFTEREQEQAKESVKNWQPQKYEKFYNVKLNVNDSYMLRREKEIKDKREAE